MNRRRRNRLIAATVIAAGVGVAVLLISFAFRDNLMFFFSPSQVMAGEAPVDKPIRVGGLVVPGTIERMTEGVTVRFDITDTAQTLTIEYDGILPDLFKEGQGVIAKGRLNAEGIMKATQVLAKHDENYMPPEVAESLRAQGAMPPHEMLEQFQK